MVTGTRPNSAFICTLPVLLVCDTHRSFLLAG